VCSSDLDMVAGGEGGTALLKHVHKEKDDGNDTSKPK